MARHDHDQHTDKSPEEIEDRVWELAEKIGFCMFVTWDGERPEARPLSASAATSTPFISSSPPMATRTRRSRTIRSST